MKSNLKEIMEARGISIRKLAEMTGADGLKVSTTSILKARENKNCETDVIDRIAEALGCEAEIVYGGQVADALKVCRRLAAALGVQLDTILKGR